MECINIHTKCVSGSKTAAEFHLRSSMVLCSLFVAKHFRENCNGMSLTDHCDWLAAGGHAGIMWLHGCGQAMGRQEECSHGQHQGRPSPSQQGRLWSFRSDRRHAHNTLTGNNHSLFDETSKLPQSWVMPDDFWGTPKTFCKIQDNYSFVKSLKYMILEWFMKKEPSSTSTVCIA